MSGLSQKAISKADADYLEELKVRLDKKAKELEHEEHVITYLYDNPPDCQQRIKGQKNIDRLKAEVQDIEKELRDSQID